MLKPHSSNNIPQVTLRDPITFYLAFTSLLKRAVEEQEPALLQSQWLRYSENLKQYRAAPHADLLRTLRQSMLRATLHVCTVRLGQLHPNLDFLFKRAAPPTNLSPQSERLIRMFKKLTELANQLHRGEVPSLPHVVTADLPFLPQPRIQSADLAAFRSELVKRTLAQIDNDYGPLLDPRFVQLFETGWTDARSNGSRTLTTWFDLYGCEFSEQLADERVAGVINNQLLAGLSFRGRPLTAAVLRENLALNSPTPPEITPQAPPEITPQTVPEIKPVEVPEVEPQRTPEIKPVETPEITPVNTPEVEPTKIPEVTPPISPQPEVTPTPEVEPTGVPEVEPEKTPEIEPEKLPEVEPEPAITSEVAPTEVPEVSPDPTPAPDSEPVATMSAETQLTSAPTFPASIGSDSQPDTASRTPVSDVLKIKVLKAEVSHRPVSTTSEPVPVVTPASALSSEAISRVSSPGVVTVVRPEPSTQMAPTLRSEPDEGLSPEIEAEPFELPPRFFIAPAPTQLLLTTGTTEPSAEDADELARLTNFLPDIVARQDLLREWLEQHRRTSVKLQFDANLSYLPGIDRRVYGRDEQAHLVLATLFDSSNRIVPIVAGAGAGKSALLARVVQQVTTRHRITDSRVGAIAYINCSSDLSIGKVLHELGLRVGQSNSLQAIYADTSKPLRQRFQEIIEAIQTSRQVWLILDNFDALLETTGTFNPKFTEFRELIEVCLGLKQDTVRLLIAVRKYPHLTGTHRLPALSKLEAALMEGLDVETATEFLRTEGKGVGLDKTAKALIHEAIIRLHGNPRALQTLVGCLVAAGPGASLASLVGPASDFVEFSDEEPKQGLMNLLSHQFDQQTGAGQAILAALARFDRPTCFAVLLLLFERSDLSELDIWRTISDLEERRLVSRRPGSAQQGECYHLDPLVAESVLEKIAEKPSIENDYLTPDYARNCLLNGVASYTQSHDLEFTNDFFAAAVCTYRLLVKDGHTNLTENLVTALLNRGTVLDDLGRSVEALEYFDDAVEYLRRATDPETDTTGTLGTVLMNRATTLEELGQHEAALSNYEEAIRLYSKLAAAGDGQAMNELATAISNQALLHERMGDWEEAVENFGESVTWREAALRQGDNAQVVAEMMQTLHYYLLCLLQNNQWPAAAQELQRAFRYRPLRLVTPEAGIALSEFNLLMKSVEDLSPDHRQSLFDSLGAEAEMLKFYLVSHR